MTQLSAVPKGATKPNKYGKISFWENMSILDDKQALFIALQSPGRHLLTAKVLAIEENFAHRGRFWRSLQISAFSYGDFAPRHGAKTTNRRVC